MGFIIFSQSIISLNSTLIVLAQIFNILFKIKLKIINKALKNNKNDKIDYFYRFQAFILFSFF